MSTSSTMRSAESGLETSTAELCTGQDSFDYSEESYAYSADTSSMDDSFLCSRERLTKNTRTECSGSAQPSKPSKPSKPSARQKFPCWPTRPKPPPKPKYKKVKCCGMTIQIHPNDNGTHWCRGCSKQLQP